eukprot:gene4501-14660_t
MLTCAVNCFGLVRKLGDGEPVSRETAKPGKTSQSLLCSFCAAKTAYLTRPCQAAAIALSGTNVGRQLLLLADKMMSPYAALDQRCLQFCKKTPSPTPTSIVRYTGQQVNRLAMHFRTNPSVGSLDIGSHPCVDDLHYYVGEDPKDVLSSEDSYVNVSRGDPTPERAGSDYFPTYLSDVLDMNLQGRTSNMMDFMLNQDVAANNDLLGTMSQPLSTNSQRRASSMMGFMLNQDVAINNLQGNTMSVPLGADSQRRTSSMMGFMLNQDLAANSNLKGNTLSLPLGTAIRRKTSGMSRRSMSNQDLPGTTSQPLGTASRRKASSLSRRFMPNQDLPGTMSQPLGTAIRRNTTSMTGFMPNQDLPSTMSQPWGTASRRRTTSMMGFMLNQDLSGTKSQPLGTASRRKTMSMTGFMSNQDLPASNQMPGKTTPLSYGTDSRRRTTSMMRPVGGDRYGRPEGSAMRLLGSLCQFMQLQHGSESTMPYGPNACVFPCGLMNAGGEKVVEGHSANEISSPLAKGKGLMEGGKGRVEEEKEAPIERKNKTSLLSKSERKLKKMVSCLMLLVQLKGPGR